MKKPGLFFPVFITCFFLVFTLAAWGRDKKPPRPPKPFENPDAILTVLVYMDQGKKCGIEVASELMELYINKQTNKVMAWPQPTLIDFKFACGDCQASGTVTVQLLDGKVFTRDQQKFLRFRVEVDNDAIMRCHPLNPLNNQKYQSEPYEADYEFPFKDGYRTNFSPSAVWMHFVLEVRTK